MARKEANVKDAFRDPRGVKEQISLQRDDTRSVIEKNLARVLQSEGADHELITEFVTLSWLNVQMIIASYSLGDDPESLRQYVEPAVHWRVKYQLAIHDKKPDLTWGDIPGGAIVMAQVLSAVVLLGTDEQRARLSEVLNLFGPHSALEFLAGQHGESLEGVEIQLPHPRPYGRLIKVVQAEPAKRSRAMADFVKHWYAGCREAIWWGGDYVQQVARAREDGDRIYYDGYWCLEAAAVTKLLNIDDSLYRDNEYYPQDLLPLRP